ncbi:Stp1/IreP family PP2C-type Ser/Thr phosphatase [Anaerosalibacter sp. Marseille-P3206]|uniref:Stp1/IreP family PP2C-type Ser/Thr phosphatase n=1 Tax=Anaerosalibacter sp. Marseille-P3206 TaxID=1871005 RepID=UPI000986A629|nr:Stp1/IreP family PP2C-type Ser/Thr phosphatase [Anaerosalibacter sp. Marseille-P3206]
MQIGVCTDRGRLRENNQDYYYSSKTLDLPLFIVADGMGGHKAGEVASKMAVEIIVEVFNSNKVNVSKDEKTIINTIKQAIDEANEKIYKKSLANLEFNGMGTTLTMAYILGKKLLVGHIGDSRVYIIQDNKIYQITEDHSLVAELVKNGSISAEEAQYHPQKNIITRAVGTSKSIDTDIVIDEVKKGDIILLCTDGLTNMIDDLEIKNIIKDNDDMQKACEGLVKRANELGGLDNITAIAVKIV